MNWLRVNWLRVNWLRVNWLCVNWLCVCLSVVILGGLVLGIAQPAWAFCGFYVAKADTKLYNNASQVAIAHSGNRTVMTMANDFRGDVKDFAIVVPVPVVLQPDQVNVGKPEILQHLDAFSAPRLVEYFDENPCELRPAFFNELRGTMLAPERAAADRRQRDTLGVTVEARFSVGEYDIEILSARESNGLEIWLRQNGYQIPQGASPLLQPYIRQGLKFFVAKVNLQEFSRTGSQFLRPLMIAYESPRFMLPIRLGMINAQSEQDMIVYLLSPRGRVELTNYRTVDIPSDAEIPVFVKNEFPEFYRSLFQTAHQRENRKVAFLEYAWDMGNCDPCSAQPLTPEELRQAGVFWLTSNEPNRVFITRLHLRYARNTFPEDLMFQETSNLQLFQGRYILRHPYTGEMNCPAGRQYQRALNQRLEREAQTLAQLTGWNIQEIRRKINFPKPATSTPWWRTLWPDRGS
ncbi:DUF2330 domain-containing protein [Trichothermofontia sp.]